MKASTKTLLPGALLPAALLLALLGACSSNPKTADSDKPETVVSKPATDAAKPGATPEARFAAALEQMKNGQLDEAEKALQALSKEQPKASGPWTNLGIIYAKTKRRDAAITALNRAVELKPDNAVAWNWLGIQYRSAGDAVRAQNAYEQAIKANSQDPLAHLNYAILLDQVLKRPQEAIAQYQEYQKLLGKPDLPSTAWIAELQAANKPAAAPAAAPAAPGAKP